MDSWPKHTRIIHNAWVATAMPSINLQQITDCIQHALTPPFVFWSFLQLVQLSDLFDSIVSKLAFSDQYVYKSLWHSERRLVCPSLKTLTWQSIPPVSSAKVIFLCFLGASGCETAFFFARLCNWWLNIVMPEISGQSKFVYKRKSVWS